jgi:hypothetical protein
VSIRAQLMLCSYMSCLAVRLFRPYTFLALPDKVRSCSSSGIFSRVTPPRRGPLTARRLLSQRRRARTHRRRRPGMSYAPESASTPPQATRSCAATWVRAPSRGWTRRLASSGGTTTSFPLRRRISPTGGTAVCRLREFVSSVVLSS